MKIHTVLAAHSAEFPYVDEAVFKNFIQRTNLINTTFKQKHVIELFK